MTEQTAALRALAQRIADAEQAVDACFEPDDGGPTADALVHGVALRTTGLLGAWQDRLRQYLGERLALLEWLVAGHDILLENPPNRVPR